MAKHKESAGHEEISSMLSQDEVDKLKERFGLEEDDHSVFLRYGNGTGKSVHWSKLRTAGLEADIERTKKELGL